MGCAQSSPSVLPYNYVPIERLYNNTSYPIIESPPAVVITVPLTSSYVKSALKKPYPNRGEPFGVLRSKPPGIHRSVNFDEQVLVKPRTPTPHKAWYEKASSTMPMRKHPPNDDDDYDYETEENASISSDDEPVNNDHIPTESDYPASLLQQNQSNNLWHKTNTTREYESSPLTMQQSPSNMNTPTANRIKVRRKLTNLDPPQMTFAPSYPAHPQSFVQSSTISAQTTVGPIHQSLVQQPNTPHFQSPIRTFLYQNPSVPSSVQQPNVSYYQSPNQISPYQNSTVLHAQTPIVSSSVQQPNPVHFQPTIRTSPNQHPPVLPIQATIVPSFVQQPIISSLYIPVQSSS